MGEPVRLQKHLARAGIASRRAAEALILQGRVSVNGQVVQQLGARVDPTRDRVAVDGRPIEVSPAVWIALHKPRGYVCTRRDPQGRRTVYDLLPPGFRSLFTVGRLDADSEGLILLTNEGDAAHRLLHPRYGVERAYRVEVEGEPDEAILHRLMQGVRLDDGMARALDARRLRGAQDGSVICIVLAEGRKREVRRMMASVGHPVRRLRRIRYGPIELGRLPPRRWRRLDDGEVARLRTGTDPTAAGDRVAEPVTGTE